MKTIERLARSQARTEDLAEERATRYQERFAELLTSVEERIPSIWVAHLSGLAQSEQHLEMLMGLTLQALQAYPREQRNTAVVAGLYAAAQAQAYTEIMAQAQLAHLNKVAGPIVAGAIAEDTASLAEDSKAGVKRKDVDAMRGAKDDEER